MSWKTYQSMTEGQLSVNGKILGNLFEFGFSEQYFFFFLHKPFGEGKETFGVGPYFTLRIPLLDLLAALSPSEMSGKTHSFKGRTLGKMEINWGRMAADDGEIARPILQLKLSLKKEGEAFFISLLGETGAVDPSSIVESNPEIIKPCNFEASFWLKQDHIKRMLVDHPLQGKLLEQLRLSSPGPS